jgi:hypothetical protein
MDAYKIENVWQGKGLRTYFSGVRQIKELPEIQSSSKKLGVCGEMCCKGGEPDLLIMLEKELP